MLSCLRRKKLACRFARRNHLSFKETKNIAIECEADSEESFAKKFAKAVNEALESSFTPLDIVANLEDYIEEDDDECYTKIPMGSVNPICQN